MSRRRFVSAAALVAAVALGATGCISSDRTTDPSFTPVPTAGADGPSSSPTPPSRPQVVDPPWPCPDKNVNVIAACLRGTGGIIPNGDGSATQVVEAQTGAIIASSRTTAPKTVATLPADPGGLYDIALSPTFDQDGLYYAILASGGSARVVRFAVGQEPKPVLTGLPAGSGAIAFSGTTLLVATAAGSGPLAGKVLAIDDPRAGDNPTRTLADGLGPQAVVCTSGSSAFVVDRAPGGDRLQELKPQAAPTAVWRFRGTAGVAGCAVTDDGVYVTLADAKQIVRIDPPTPQRPTVSEPTPMVNGEWGVLGRIVPVPGAGVLQVATSNRGTPKAGPTEDRVFVITAAGSPPENRS